MSFEEKSTTWDTTASVDGKKLRPLIVMTVSEDPIRIREGATEVITGVGAVLAGVEATSYKTDNDALSAKNVGRKTPEILLGGGFILPWRKGGRWIEKAYCGSTE